MERNKMVLEILSLYDHIDYLKHQLEAKTHKTQVIEKEVEVNRKLSKEESYLLKLGKEAFYEKVCYTWQDVKVSRNGEGELKVQKLEDFVKKTLQADRLPIDMSQARAVDVLSEQFEKHYQEKKQEAIDNFLAKEKRELEEKEKAKDEKDVDSNSKEE